jgi:hypothetical protein
VTVAPIYPTDIVTEDGQARIHKGHALPPDAVLDDARVAFGDVIASVRVEEVHFRHVPRVRWCERLDGFGCDRAGDWHGHWTAVRAGTPRAAFTVAWPVYEQRGDRAPGGLVGA